MASHEIDLSAALWRKSSYSNGTGGECVEVAAGLPGVVPVRDSKSHPGPVLLIAPTPWSTFIAALKQ
ncbi:DUF397 domain-containing protein [Streptomyces sp. 2A115]|uniref:DUF397 domain-containing protein n=1 Tax=Streptomyces sp. 2A115 TaxID=3457439 RepID=UPI003FCFB907